MCHKKESTSHLNQSMCHLEESALVFFVNFANDVNSIDEIETKNKYIERNWHTKNIRNKIEAQIKPYKRKCYFGPQKKKVLYNFPTFLCQKPE